MSTEVADRRVDWDRTEMEKERLLSSPYYTNPDSSSKYGYYAGRFIIGRDTPINGGIYLGGYSREAIVVDDEKYPRELNFLYEKVLSLRSRKRSLKPGLLSTVHEVVKEALRYDHDEVELLIQPFMNDRKVALNFFLIHGVGICRHQALAVAYILERLAKEGYVSGKVSVDRNHIPGQGGHAWVRYRNSQGRTFIIDSAQNYCGSVDDVPRERWLYGRPIVEESITPILEEETSVSNTMMLWLAVIGLIVLKIVINATFSQLNLFWISVLCSGYVFATTPYFGRRGDLPRFLIRVFKYILVGNVFWILVWYTLATRI